MYIYVCMYVRIYMCVHTYLHIRTHMYRVSAVRSKSAEHISVSVNPHNGKCMCTYVHVHTYIQYVQ